MKWQQAILITLLTVLAAPIQAADSANETIPANTNAETPEQKAAFDECFRKGVEKRRRDWERDSAERRKRGLKPHRPYETGTVEFFCKANTKGTSILKNTAWK